MHQVACLPTLEELRGHVHRTLCANDNLDPDQTPLWHGPIVRRGKVCGMFFEVKGPRLLKNHAIWASAEDRVLFYNSQGERFLELRLSEAPEVRRVAA